MEESALTCTSAVADTGIPVVVGFWTPISLLPETTANFSSSLPSIGGNPLAVLLGENIPRVATVVDNG